MQKHNINITGSNANFYTKRSELEALIDQKDLFTIWYTLSAAKNHWMDLHNFLQDRTPMSDISGPIKKL